MGQELVLLEAMKMENLITADCDGKVKKLLVKDGAVVAAEQIIIEFA
jgi:propionyl-CoA carboxylase alpha chain